MGKRAPKHRNYKQGYKKTKIDWSNMVLPQENEIFRSYYQQQLQLSEHDFNLFWASMKEKLPVVFRVNANCPNYSSFVRKLQDEEFLQNIVKFQENQHHQNQQYQPKELPKLQLLDWYPGNILFTLNTSKTIFKKSNILKQLHKYLQKGFDSGLIARQQLVSMLPPLYLDIQSDDIVLDMCAAPGSKTSQLLEMIYGVKRSLARGCVIANDADYSRAHMLIHQIHRSGTVGTAVINHPGQFMPELYIKKINSIRQKFLFDKVLCDVPCSGDGATRKLPIKWAKWHTSDGMVLHPLQLAILMKSVNLLKKGGLLVYSTCSLNPIENEAVINALLSKVTKGLELVDIHPMYKVKGRRGLLHWDVYTVKQTKETKVKAEEQGGKIQQQETIKVEEQLNLKDNIKLGKIQSKYLKKYQNIEEAKQNPKIKASMFAPTEKMAQQRNLHYTMRVLPHDQNSGGFFVALLRKTQNFEWKYITKENKLSEEQNEEQVMKQNLSQIQINVVKQNQDIQEQLKLGREEEQQSSEVKQMNDDNQQEEEKQKWQQKEYQERLEEQVQLAEQTDKNPQGVKKQGGKISQKDKQKHKIEKKGKGDKKKKERGEKYEKFELLKEEEYQSISKFYGMSKGLRELLFVRSNSKARTKVMLVSEGVRKFLDYDTAGKINLVNMGCRVFEKGKESFAGHECLYRLSQEGIHFLLPELKYRKVKVPFSFWKSMLHVQSLSHDKIDDEKVKEQIMSMSQGSFCIYIQEQINGSQVIDAIVGQNFKSSFNLMVGKEEIASLLIRYQ